MHVRTRYRMSAVPTPIVCICVACFVVLGVILAVPQIQGMLADEMGILKWVVITAAILAPIAFLGWYSLTWAEVRNGRFKVRSISGGYRVDLRRLAAVDVHPKPRSASPRRRHELILRLEDSNGGEAWLPLNVWRDEDLLMARVLRASVERKVAIEGDPMLVRRFTSLLDTYKSWDRQQAAA